MKIEIERKALPLIVFSVLAIAFCGYRIGRMASDHWWHHTLERFVSAEDREWQMAHVCEEEVGRGAFNADWGVCMMKKGSACSVLEHGCGWTDSEGDVTFNKDLKAVKQIPLQEFGLP